MKTFSRIGSLCLVACSLNLLVVNYPVKAQSSTYQQPGDTPPDFDELSEVSTETFEEELAPYGDWINTPEYGRVWIPTVDKKFQPYATNGHWVITSYGNTWVSDYPWGWAAFHYGRWYHDSRLGWAWVPGRVWGPSWVTWRSGNGYYGWAPLGPSVSININLPLFSWIFVRQEYITSPTIHNYYVYYGSQTTNIYQNTTIIRNNYRVSNRTYVYGPRQQEIATVTNRPVTVYRLDRQSRAGRSVVNNGSVSIYRPASSRRRDSGVNSGNSGQINSGEQPANVSRRRRTNTNQQPQTVNQGNNQNSESRRTDRPTSANSNNYPATNRQRTEQQSPETRESRRTDRQTPASGNAGGYQAPESRRERQTPANENSGGGYQAPESRRTERQEAPSNNQAPESRSTEERRESSRDSDSGAEREGRRSTSESESGRGRSR
jgi:hypothetical protein